MDIALYVVAHCRSDVSRARFMCAPPIPPRPRQRAASGSGTTAHCAGCTDYRDPRRSDAWRPTWGDYGPPDMPATSSYVYWVIPGRRITGESPAVGVLRRAKGIVIGDAAIPSCDLGCKYTVFCQNINRGIRDLCLFLSAHEACASAS